MKILKTIGILPAIAICASALITTGCKEDSFDQDGEGLLRLQLVVNSNVTRAIENEDYLRSNCVVYISGDGKLLHKYKGLENVPSELHMKNGSYVAEAWSGDSVGASYDKKFFRGYEPFTISGGETSVVVKCKIANVVASVNHSTIDPEVMKDWNVTFSHSRASLDINEDTQTEKAYFMLPNADKDLHYKVTGKRADGKEFSKEGVIENVQRAHEYVVNFSYTPDNTQMGGAFIQIVIDDQNIEEKTDVPLYSKPDIKGENFDITGQIIGDPGNFTSESIAKVSAFGGIKTMNISSDDYAALSWPANNMNLIDLSESLKNDLNNKGLTWDIAYNSDRNLATSFIHLSAAYLNSLPEKDTEYAITVNATDIYGKSNSAVIRIAVGENAITYADPVLVEEIASNDQMAVLSRSATLKATITDAEALNPRIEYREAGTTDWQSVALGTRASGTSLSVTVKNLKPSTRYEYRAATDEFQGESMFFTTEGVFTIPNAGMEDWSDFVDNTKVLLPSDDGTKKFWDSGNHGSATMNVNLTQPSTELFKSGSKSARLRSQFAGIGSIGKFAAGNLFAGEYLETQGTDGRLSFGQRYDGSHPTKLKFYANYRPGTVDSKGKGDYLAQGATDQAQIYVALSTQPVEVRTKKSNRKLFNPEDPEIIAYGEVSWTEAFGADGELKEVNIPINYYDKAKTTKPLYLIIVCSASKFGDYFNGGEGSTMYVDDFELVYE